jgi:hypothetical protein
LVIAATALLFAAFAPPLIYLLASRSVPLEEHAVDPASFPPETYSLLWARIGGTGEPQLPRLSPYTFLFRGMAPFQEPEPALRLALLATRPLLGARPRDVPVERWRLIYAAAVIRVTRHWTPSQALAAVVQNSFFGQGFRGLHEASKGYFGRGVFELSQAELAVLLVSARSPVLRDPWCRPAENRAAVIELLQRRQAAPPLPDSPLASLLPPPPGACPRG